MCAWAGAGICASAYVFYLQEHQITAVRAQPPDLPHLHLDLHPDLIFDFSTHSLRSYIEKVTWQTIQTISHSEPMRSAALRSAPRFVWRAFLAAELPCRAARASDWCYGVGNKHASCVGRRIKDWRSFCSWFNPGSRSVCARVHSSISRADNLQVSPPTRHPTGLRVTFELEVDPERSRVRFARHQDRTEDLICAAAPVTLPSVDATAQGKAARMHTPR